LCRFDHAAPRRAFIGLLCLIGIACGTRTLLHAATAHDDYRAMWELAFLCGVTLIFYHIRPLSRAITASPLWRPAAALGTISYSLYLIHRFNLTLQTAVGADSERCSGLTGVVHAAGAQVDARTAALPGASPPDPSPHDALREF
jgi:peptidoglycan/LPS O-acetylase OafA/YrhL